MYQRVRRLLGFPIGTFVHRTPLAIADTLLQGDKHVAAMVFYTDNGGPSRGEKKHDTYSNYRSILSVSTLMTGQHGVTEMCLSLPCVVGANGVEEILTLLLSKEEQNVFRSSSEKLKATLASLGG